MLLTNYLFTNLETIWYIYIYIYIYTYIYYIYKHDLALNNLQRLLCCKTQQTNPTDLFFPMDSTSGEALRMQWKNHVSSNKSIKPLILNVVCMSHLVIFWWGLFRDQVNDLLSFLHVNCSKNFEYVRIKYYRGTSEF